jgi:Leucine-rich repeat (LRR) protein
VNLRLLDFNDNMLNSLPAEIGNLTSLKKLNLGGNLLKELPPEIGYRHAVRLLLLLLRSSLTVVFVAPLF